MYSAAGVMDQVFELCVEVIISHEFFECGSANGEVQSDRHSIFSFRPKPIAFHITAKTDVEVVLRGTNPGSSLSFKNGRGSSCRIISPVQKGLR